MFYAANVGVYAARLHASRPRDARRRLGRVELTHLTHSQSSGPLILRQYHRSFANLVDERGEHWAHIQREDKYNLPATSNMITVLHV